MPPGSAPPASRPATGQRRRRLPAVAEGLRLPLHLRSQQRMTERWGFDLNSPEAAARAEALLAASPADPEVLVLAAAVRSSRGDDAGALEAARAAVDADAASARAHTTLAALLARSGDVEDTNRHALAAAELDAEDPAALYNRGLALWAAGEHRAARQDFQRAAAILGVTTVPWWRRPRRPA